MKFYFLTLALFSNLAMAAQSYDGVEYNCMDKALKKMSKHSELELITACRTRSDASVEEYMFCDGSECAGFVMTFTNNKCKVSDSWYGQDDQDYINPEDWKKSCLVPEDFKR